MPPAFILSQNQTLHTSFGLTKTFKDSLNLDFCFFGVFNEMESSVTTKRSQTRYTFIKPRGIGHFKRPIHQQENRKVFKKSSSLTKRPIHPTNFISTGSLQTTLLGLQRSSKAALTKLDFSRSKSESISVLVQIWCTNEFSTKGDSTIFVKKASETVVTSVETKCLLKCGHLHSKKKSLETSYSA